VRAYSAIFSARFRALLQYRAAALAGLGTQIFWGFVHMMIFAAFYASSTAAQPMQLEQVITYIWLKQALLLLLPWRPDPDVEAMVRTGNVAYELARPVDLYWLWYARALAMRTAPALLRCIPMVVLALLVFGMELPATPSRAAAFLASVAVAVLLSAALTALLSISLLFTVDGRGVQGLTTSIVNAFSGALAPLPFFPEWFQTIADVLPFRGLMDIPFRLYLGHIPVDALWGALAHQLAWTAALVVAGRALLQRAVRRMVVQGG
jgi:ABC-2 type transport system permease protein